MLRFEKENLMLILLAVVALAGGIFITKDECPPNEEYLLCGSACAANCSDPDVPVTCSDDCVEGCFCKAGFLRGDNSTCVSADQCAVGNSSVCTDNEEFLSCGSGCPPTCSQPEPSCGPACSAGCFCKSGFVRDTANNKCVTLDQCPVEQCLNQDEVYDICNAECEPTCAEPAPLCAAVCAGGCVCAAGLLRDAAGACVALDKCPANGTEPGLLGKYMNVINRILHLSATAQ